MSKRAISLSFRVVAAGLSLVLAGAAAVAQRPSYSVIANLGIHPGEGLYPDSPVVFDQSGNLYGITQRGGHYQAGAIFELLPKADGNWTEKTIASFHNSGVNGPLAVDADGNLYGTEAEGGTNYFGSVFEVSPSADGSWKKTEIYSFQSNKGGNTPSSGVVLDKAGNIYGVTSHGGMYGAGTFFELSHQPDGSWTGVTRYSFRNPHFEPTPIGLTMDLNGDFYGTIVQDSCAGQVFHLTKPESKDGSWTYTTLHTFPPLQEGGNTSPTGDAACPGNVIMDAQGNLYGTGSSGGKYGHGTVFEIPAGGGADGPDKLLYSFHLKSGAEYPVGTLAIDSAGNLYGVTTRGGSYETAYGGGKLFELLPQQNGSWRVKSLHEFGGRIYNGVTGADGFYPLAGLTIGPDNSLYGTTYFGGYYPGETNGSTGRGTVFKVVVP